MRAWKLSRQGLVVALAAVVVVGMAWPAHAGQVAKKQEILMGPYFETLKPGDSIEESIKRGEKVFNELGCAGCHPRGGSLGEGVTAVDATGNRMPIPIPDLRGAALHYPRIGGSGFIATLGMLNDMWNTVFLGREPMDPNSQEYIDMYAYVASLTPEVKKAMLDWEKKRIELEKKVGMRQ